MGIFIGVPREDASNDSGVVEERTFHRLILAICWETLDKICRIYIQDILPFNIFSVVPKCMSRPWMNVN